MTDPNLVTTRSFNGRDYFIKMNVANNVLELIATDKQTGEDWQCNYEASYIEGITQKTGNFKQFDIFVTMLKSGLLKTSNCVFLDLMTFEDLDSLRNHRLRGPFSAHHIAAQTNNNRRYLILTYTVEFDRIHYPLPLEYCGPPDPQILQTHIRRLEEEVAHLRNELLIKTSCKNDTKIITSLQKRVEELTQENQELHEEIKKLNSLSFGKKPRNQIYILQNAIRKLENSVLVERSSHHRLVEKLKYDKESLIRQLEKLKISEKQLRTKFTNSSSPRGGNNLKRMSDPGEKNTIRSQSPRVCQSESWETHVPRSSRVERKGVRKKSRSSSESSGKNLGYVMKLIGCEERALSNRSRCRNVPKLYSRSPSVPSSRTSSQSTERNVLTHQDLVGLLSPRKTPNKPTSLDFANLETRITALQKALFSDRRIDK